jgi:hypothetical protein
MNGSLEIKCRLDPQFFDNPDNMAETESGLLIHQGPADTLTSADVRRMATNLRFLKYGSNASMNGSPEGYSDPKVTCTESRLQGQLVAFVRLSSL